jgi:hypothetical protein
MGCLNNIAEVDVSVAYQVQSGGIHNRAIFSLAIDLRNPFRIRSSGDDVSTGADAWKNALDRILIQARNSYKSPNARGHIVNGD